MPQATGHSLNLAALHELEDNAPFPGKRRYFADLPLSVAIGQKNLIDSPSGAQSLSHGVAANQYVLGQFPFPNRIIAFICCSLFTIYFP